MTTASPLTAYKQIQSRTVVWGDMDFMRHVNNTKYFYYCETVRIEFLRQLFPELGTADPDTMRSGIALAETGCRFKRSITYPDELQIGTGVVSIDETQFVLQHAIYSTKLDSIAAEATARMVHYDFVQNKRVPLSEIMRKTLEGYSL